ncbi:MAG TPA: hypothetical protein VGS19_26000 [Streptosporangiaceae bacterium]|nr:hypothetical protein [Streptosporangiaceae bacterium]
MSEDDIGRIQQNGGPGPPPPSFVIVAFTTQPTAQMFVGMPFTVQGTASSSPPGNVTGVGLTFDGVAVPVVDDSPVGDWSNWHAVVTPATAAAHTFSATASGLGKTRTATLHLTAVPVLTCVSPPVSAGVVTTGQLALVLGIQVATAALVMTPPPTWQYQLGSGPWQAPAGVTELSPANWQLTITLPATPAGPAGTSYPLQVRATPAQGLPATLALTVQAVDTTAPTVSVTVPGYAPAGATPAISLQASDELKGVVFSGIQATGVSVQFDGQQCAVTQTTGGDPSSWSATLPPLTHATHQVLVTVKDVAGNTTTAARTIWVDLTSWTRLETVPRDPTLMRGLQARVADPLWQLARQVAFGEFAGQDTASPAAVRMRARASSLTRLRPAFAPGSTAPATGPGELLPSAGGPLEVLTEAEPEPQTGGAPRPVFAAQAGLQYRRMLTRAVGVGDLSTYERGLLAAYPVPPSASAAGTAGVPPASAADDPALLPYSGRVPDGERLYADLVAALRPPGPGTLPAAPALGGASPTVVASVARAWLSWYEAVSGQEPGQVGTWVPGRLEYAFSVAAPGPDAETVLAAAELDTGELDWYDFDLLASSEVPPSSPSVSLGAAPTDLPGGPTSILFVGLPTPVAFRGMPLQRWSDFEDSAIDFGAITAPVESLTTSVVVEFAMRYGNDHFIIPVPLAVGSVLRVDSLVVVDTFGEVLLIRPIAEADTAAGPFRLFEHATPAAAGGTPTRDPLFVLFPTVGEVVQGPAVEEVHFVRDEAAELVWAIEQTALGPDGLPVDRTAGALAHFLALTPTPNDGTAPSARAYVLRTDVEANWFPFLPSGAPPATQLAMADVPPLDPTQPTPLPWGRILAPYAPVAAGQPGVLMPLEEVTRAGAQVMRAWRYARWVDGRQLSWVGRTVRPGRGPGASGLSFDLAL